MAVIQAFSGPGSSSPACLSFPRRTGEMTKGGDIGELRPAEGNTLDGANIVEFAVATELSFYFSLEHPQGSGEPGLSLCAQSARSSVVSTAQLSLEARSF